MKAYRQSSSLLRTIPIHARINTATSTSTATSLFARRTFFPNPFDSKLQTLTATRTVPYPASAVYAVVSDVSQYSSFLPFCRESTVTKTSSPDPSGKTWPEEAKLVVGYNNDVSETFWSRVYCQPEQIVEAVSGATETTLSPDAIAHHSQRAANGEEDPTRNGKVLTHLLTRWNLRPFPYKAGPINPGEKPQETQSPLPAKELTQVSLAIEYRFANPIYAGMSAAAAPKVADYMMTAFEKRVQQLLDGPSTGEKVGSHEGVSGNKGQEP